MNIKKYVYTCKYIYRNLPKELPSNKFHVSKKKEGNNNNDNSKNNNTSKIITKIVIR